MCVSQRFPFRQLFYRKWSPFWHLCGLMSWNHYCKKCVSQYTDVYFTVITVALNKRHSSTQLSSAWGEQRSQKRDKGGNSNSHTKAHSFTLMIHIESAQNIYWERNLAVAAAGEKDALATLNKKDAVHICTKTRQRAFIFLSFFLSYWIQYSALKRQLLPWVCVIWIS